MRPVSLHLELHLLWRGVFSCSSAQLCRSLGGAKFSVIVIWTRADWRCRQDRHLLERSFICSAEYLKVIKCVVLVLSFFVNICIFVSVCLYICIFVYLYIRIRAKCQYCQEVLNRMLQSTHLCSICVLFVISLFNNICLYICRTVPAYLSVCQVYLYLFAGIFVLEYQCRLVIHLFSICVFILLLFV